MASRQLNTTSIKKRATCLVWPGLVFILCFGLVYAQPIHNAVTIQKPGIVKFDWTSGNLDYKGVNANADAADGDTDWTIYKYTWVSSNPTVVQERQGSWTLRATYF